MKKTLLWVLAAIIIINVLPHVLKAIFPHLAANEQNNAIQEQAKTTQQTPKPALSGVWITNTKLKDCRPVIASSYEAFRTAYDAMIAGNDRFIAKLVANKVIDLFGDGREVHVLHTKEIAFGSLAKLDNKSDVDEIWTDFRCLVKK